MDGSDKGGPWPSKGRGELAAVVEDVACHGGSGLARYVISIR
jgi:hypothetical protein